MKAEWHVFPAGYGIILAEEKKMKIGKGFWIFVAGVGNSFRLRRNDNLICVYSCLPAGVGVDGLIRG